MFRNEENPQSKISVKGEVGCRVHVSKLRMKCITGMSVICKSSTINAGNSKLRFKKSKQLNAKIQSSGKQTSL